MPQLNIEERIFLVEQYHKSVRFGRNNRPSVKWTLNSFSEHFHRDPPNRSTLWELVKKFEENGTILNLNKGKSGRPRTVRSNDNHGVIFEKVLRSPRTWHRQKQRTADPPRPGSVLVQNPDPADPSTPGSETTRLLRYSSTGPLLSGPDVAREHLVERRVPCFAVRSRQ